MGSVSTFSEVPLRELLARRLFRERLCLVIYLFLKVLGIKLVSSGMVDARQPENLLWNIERIVTNIFIPILNSSSTGDGNEDLKIKVKNELLPCLRSFTRYVLHILSFKC